MFAADNIYEGDIFVRGGKNNTVSTCLFIVSWITKAK